MRTGTIPAAIPAARHTWRTMGLAMALTLLAGGFSAAVIQPTAAQSATMAIDQCNGHGPGAGGATTRLRCTVTVVNTISGTSTHSTTTVTRLCTLGPCSTPNGTFRTESASLVTTVRQCNSSDNDAAHTIDCAVTITNTINEGTPDARPLTGATVNQCVGSGGGSAGCQPFQASAGAMVTQCNGSANGGGGMVHCTVEASSRVSRAIPVTVNQCNGTGNPGGSVITCRTSVTTNVIGPAAVAVAATPAAKPPASTTGTPTQTPTKTATATATKTAARTTATTAATTVAPAPVRFAQPLSDSAATAAESTSGPERGGLLLLGVGLLLAAAITALIFRRFAPAGSRYARRH